MSELTEVKLNLNYRRIFKAILWLYNLICYFVFRMKQFINAKSV